MDANIESLILESLREPSNAISYTVSQRLTAMFRDRAVLACNTADIDLLEFARERQCRAEPHPGIHSELLAQWHGPGGGVDETAGNSWYDVTWNENRLSVLRLSWEAAFQTRVGYWIVAANRLIAKQFLIAISEWCATARGEIVVFEAGCWHKSKELYASIQGATFENLILPEAMKQEIQEDFKRFFASRDQYSRYGIPWKRGVLFHGPPGNGKTHTLKSLINRLGHPCLYVKSFKPKRFESEHETIRAVFDRARQTTPCLLVLEDLDSLVDDGNRSFFLNELDGFAANTGVVVLATTNHPERLDPAILNRPSRFDRKYAFGLPTRQERMEYLLMWNERSKPEMRLSEQGALAITEATDEFSFAYLKELWLSSMIRWIDEAKPGGMDDVMAGQAAMLREQMSTPMSEPAPATDAEDPMLRIMRSFTGH